MSIIVTIATYRQPSTAYFLKEQLEAESIDCFFSKTLGGDEIKVQVNGDHVEKAVKVLLRIQEEFGKLPENYAPRDMVRKIIVPTDFSSSSEYACHFAIHLAQKIKAEIKLLHIFDNPMLNMGLRESATYMDYVHSTIAEVERHVNAELVAFTTKMKSYMHSRDIDGVRIHSSMVMGSVLPGIKGIAKSYEPDFVVLGTATTSGGSESVLGGLADTLVQGLGIPLCAIPGPISGEHVHQFQVLYATDFNENDNSSLESLLRILEPFEKRISCIHVATDPQPAKRERMDELNMMLQHKYGEYEIQCMLIEDDDIVNGIKDFAAADKSNLISFTIHKRGIFDKLFKPNLFRKIMREANMPVLLFPSKLD